MNCPPGSTCAATWTTSTSTASSAASLAVLVLGDADGGVYDTSVSTTSFVGGSLYGVLP